MAGNSQAEPGSTQSPLKQKLLISLALPQPTLSRCHLERRLAVQASFSLKLFHALSKRNGRNRRSLALHRRPNQKRNFPARSARARRIAKFNERAAQKFLMNLGDFTSHHGGP